jgi:hypothetical protein
MKWKAKSTAQIGDIRKLVKFAWFPITLTDGDVVWLEKYRVTECYESRYTPTKFFISVYRTNWHIVRADVYVPKVL